jgi:hypothetical protein
MNPQLLQQLEEMCDAAIPRFYLAVLDAYPASLRDIRRADDGSLDEGQVSDVELLMSEADVVEINREVRAVTILDPEGQEFRWPDQLLVIGETGDGDYYCIDIDGEHEGVLQFRHYAVEFEVIADSLKEFVEMLEDAFVTRSEGSDDFDDQDSEEEIE